MEEIVVTGVKEGVTTRLTAPFEAVYVCVNGGGQVPSATNKTTFVGNLEASALFPAAKNGKATGSLLTGPLPSSAAAAAATGFTCPSGQSLEFDRVIFSNMVLSVDGGETIQLATVLVSESVHGVNESQRGRPPIFSRGGGRPLLHSNDVLPRVRPRRP